MKAYDVQKKEELEVTYDDLMSISIPTVRWIWFSPSRAKTRTDI